MNSHFKVLNPCSKRWTDLKGEGRERFCETCQTPVYDYSQYSAEEWRRLWDERDGKVCGLLCEETPEPPRTRRAILAGALLSFVSPLLAQNGRLRLRVADLSGAPIPMADCELLDSNGKVKATTRADENGEAFFQSMPAGAYRIRIGRQGFQTTTINFVGTGRAEATINVTLMLGNFVGEVVFVEANPSSFSTQLDVPTADLSGLPFPSRRLEIPLYPELEKSASRSKRKRSR